MLAIVSVGCLPGVKLFIMFLRDVCFDGLSWCMLATPPIPSSMGPPIILIERGVPFRSEAKERGAIA